MIQFHQEGLEATTVATAIILAAIANTVVKTSLAAWFGGKTLARQVAPGMATILIAGGLVIIWMG